MSSKDPCSKVNNGNDIQIFLFEALVFLKSTSQNILYMNSGQVLNYLLVQSATIVGTQPVHPFAKLATGICIFSKHCTPETVYCN